MKWLPEPRTSLYAQLAFAGVVLAVFTQLAFVESLRGPEWRVVATFALAVPYTVLFSNCHHVLAEPRRRRWLRLYYVVQTAIVGTMIWISPSRGFFAIIALPLVSQAIFDFTLRGAALVTLGVFIPTVAIWMTPYGFAGIVRALITYAPAFLFAITFTLITRKAIEARQQSEKLSAELASANDQLRAQSAQTAELATTRERNRLAREIHDGVGHYLTTIKVQLDAAAALLPADPGRAADSVQKAARLAAEALDDVRRSVRALATDATQPPLDDLLQRLAADASPAPRIQISGTPRPLSTAVEHALYRAAQEGLTNIRKHAAATSAALTVDFAHPARVRLTLADNGRGPAADSLASPGYGLRGLHERIALLGGRISAGPQTGGGFRLEVELPT